MLSNGVGLIKLENGGILRLDAKDYLKFCKDKWQWVKRAGDSIFVVTANGTGGGKSRYLHAEMGLTNKNVTKKLVFLNGDRFDYRRRNLVYKDYPQYTRNASTKTVERKHFTIEGNILGVLENKAIIRIDEERDLVCAMCSLTDIDMYCSCLDVAAEEQWPGWKSLGGPVCREMRKYLDEENVRYASGY